MNKAEEVLRTYINFEDANGSKPITLLPLTIIDAMEEYATLKLQEQAKEIERLKEEKDMFMERCNQLTKTNDELQAIITKHLTNH